MNTTHPHLEGLIRKWKDRADYHECAASQEGLSEAQEQWRNGMAEMAYDCARELEAALAALPGGGVEELTYKPEQVSNEHWMRCLDMATAFMPGARDAWTRFTDKPWNKHAIHRVLAEFAASLPTPNPHEADRNE